jgi:hypothetical protein
VKPILADLGLVTVGDETRWAVTSPDDRYRYVLGRTWDDFFGAGSHRPLWTFVMLNPSTARTEDDPTVRKCIGFAKRGGAGGLMIVNLFAYSTPYPKELVRAHFGDADDIIGPQNDPVLRWALGRPALLGRNIAAWGRIPPKLRKLAIRPRVPGVECFGLNGDGTPKHPLMLGYETPLVRWDAAWVAAKETA